MRSSNRRSKKYNVKIDGTISQLRLLRYGGKQKELFKSSVDRQVEIERCVKTYLNSYGITSMLTNYYILAAKKAAELIKKFGGDVSDNEIAILKNKWINRGLDETHLGNILSRCGGYKTPPPPPPPPIGVMDYIFTSGASIPFSVIFALTDMIDSGYTVSTSEASDASGYGGGRRTVKTSTGKLYAVYYKQSGGFYQVYVKESSDNGVTWVNETLISTYAGMNLYEQNAPSIAIDSNDYLHVVWHGKATGYTGKTQIWYALYNGSWQSPVRISTLATMDGKNQEKASITVTSDDNIHVVWHGGTTTYPVYEIWYALYNGAWQSPVRLSTYPGMNLYESVYGTIETDSNDYLHVTFNGYATGYTTGPQIWYVLWNGAWQIPVRISTYDGMVTRDQLRSCIAVTSDDDIHVVWHGKATDYPTIFQVWYASKIGGVWQTPVRISTYDGMGSYDQEESHIGVDSNGYLHVVWHGKATGYTDNNCVWLSNYTTFWSTPTPLQTASKSQYPHIRWSYYNFN